MANDGAVPCLSGGTSELYRLPAAVRLSGFGG